METKQKQLIYTGLFKSRENIEGAYNALYKKGYGKNSINIIMSEESRSKYFADVKTKGDEPSKQRGMSAAINAGVNVSDAIKDGIVITESKLLVAGPLSAGLSGAGEGEFSSGVISSLLGIPDVEAKAFEEGINNGYMIMSVQPCTGEDVTDLEKIWQDNNVSEVYKK